MQSNLGSLGFSCVMLDEMHQVYTGEMLDNLILGPYEFDSLWVKHPAEYHRIHIHGRDVATPRWQQAYGHNYHYTGRTNNALPLLPILKPIVSWCPCPFAASIKTPREPIWCFAIQVDEDGYVTEPVGGDPTKLASFEEAIDRLIEGAQESISQDERR